MPASTTVSIVIPAFNVREYIDETLTSIWKQRYRDYAVIVVDDGSTDGLKQHLETQYGERLTVIRQENRGLSAARNTGIRAWQSPYVFFLDGDDLILPDHLEALVTALDRSPRMDVVFTDHVRFVDHPDNQFEHVWGDKPEGGREMWPLFIKSNPIAIGTAMVRRAVIDRFGMFDESMGNYCADWDLWFGLAMHGASFLYLDRKSALYRQRAGNLSSNLAGAARGDLMVMERAYERARRLQHPALALLPKAIALRHYCLARALLLEGKRVEAIRHLLTSIRKDPTFSWKRRYVLLSAALLMPAAVVRRCWRFNRAMVPVRKPSN
jgi:GT2 family glycosyltransferase